MRRLLALILLMSACSGPADPCAQVRCSVGRVCESSTGRCVAIDAGDVTDAGTDAGVTDAGVPDAGPFGDGGLDCTPACSGASKCDPSSGRCVQCLSDRDCACPAYACVNNLCLQPAVDPDAGTPVVSPPPAESCAAAQPFSFFGCTVPRSFKFRVNLAGRADEEQGVCSAPAGGGRELVYVLSLEATYDLTVSAAPVNGSGAFPLVYVRRMPCGGQELACDHKSGPFEASVHLRSRTAGDYALFIDTFDAATAGEVEVTVTLSAPTQPSNDTCLLADELPIDGGVVRADLSNAGNDEVATCNALGGPDLVWRFSLSQPGDIVARAASVSPDAGVLPIIELHQGGCSMGSARACQTASSSGVAGLRLRGADAGTYYLVVETTDGTPAGLVDVSVSVQDPSPPLQHDTCAAPLDIVFADGGTFVELDVDTSTASDDEDGTCNATGGPEYVYHLRLLSPRRVVVTATRGAGGTADPVLYLRQTSCVSGGELGCSDDPSDSAAPEQLTSGMGTLPPGDYYIFVESYGSSVGPTHLTVSATP